MKEVIKCPCCAGRVFDVVDGLGCMLIEVKCPKCRKVVEIKLNKYLPSKETN